MAIYATGVTATFNGTTLGEVAEINVAGGGSLPIARNSRFAVDAGTIDVQCFLAAGIGPAAYGQKGTFAITGGGLTFTTKAILQTYKLAGKANDVARYAATLKIVME
jgi:hypothetical protein